MPRVPLIASLCFVCLVSMVACTSSADPPRRDSQASGTQAQPVAHAEASSRAEGMPTWPKIETALRQFPGEQMFIDRKGGRWAAWVVSVPSGNQAEAMEFFTGQRMTVTFEAIETLPRTYRIIDPQGLSRTWQAGASFLVDDRDGNNGGAIYFGDAGNAIDFRESLYVEGRQGRCPLELSVISRMPTGQVRIPHATASKVLMYLDAPSADCPNGKWVSDIHSALDLRDGTMLVTLGDYVVRLRHEDLLPVGDANGVLVRDASDIRALIARMTPENAADPNHGLSQMLKAD